MKTVNLGELEVSAIGLGCMGMSQAYGKADPEESERTLHRALDIGVTFLDTANVYGMGHNEKLVGRVLNKRRNEIQLATKFGISVEDGKRGINGRPEQVASRCDESLQRLQTEVIDLYYLHRLDPDVPIEETVGAMADLIKAGKVRYLGLSEVSARTLRKAHAVHPISAVQSEYSLWTRDPEDHVLGACRELGVGFVPFSPMGRAILTGTITNDDSIEAEGDMRSTMPRFQGENLANNLKLVESLGEIAESQGITRGQIALAWLLAQGDFIAPIPGTKRVSYLEENAAAVDIQLDPGTLSKVDELFAVANVSGERYTEAGMRSLDRD
ncbi:MAG: aldo/keto reductase [bacterium]|nr:aldo/keto reductase [Gammaproteobacteria bacterium]HIL96752.1 aldo/keto reductase [Pseudomonadales bacterium]